ncbi:MAG TPA: FHA domain-containing protein [Solirubrobacteraceae bacterium]|jgi:hypothetical protein|nr:FHA domain-containing protein [Solirubrobacteraceae bacterium]
MDVQVHLQDPAGEAEDPSPGVRAPEAHTAKGRAVEVPFGRSRGPTRPLPHLGRGRHLVIEEPGEQRVVTLSAPTVRVGRGMSADVMIDDTTVSRRHALIVHRGQRTMILDDRSSNGVFVNGRRVSEAPLRDADVITLGRVVIVYVDVY